ncbi:MAG: glycoside hydrolase family 172 protein [Planctomycetota bacterium]
MASMSRAALSLAFFVCLSGTAAPQPITTESLVKEMVDLTRLADFPQPAYKTVQFSSYDRRSKVPGGPDWFANSDGFGGDPIPNFEAVVKAPGEDGVGEYLIADLEGPGAIVRCWTAAISGSLRMYLDGASQPIYEGPAEDFLLHPFNVFAPRVGLDPALFDGSFNQQNASYCPMPFAKRCRIVWIGKIPEIHFYEVQVRRYAAGTQVATFKPEDLATCKATIEKVAAVLRAPGANWRYATPESEARSIIATVEGRSAHELLKLENGPGALERLTLKVRAQDVNRALRQTILQIMCDGYPWGQVQSPLGDFFGAAPGVNAFDSVPFTVAQDGTMTCRLVMPFQQSLKIFAGNRGEEPVTITGSVLPMKYTWTDRSMHFRARWRVQHDIQADPRMVRDIPFIAANGQGRYVGTAAFLFNPTDVPTPYGGWWGEGDEKIFVDDDAFPSTFGTGSEDYFNYAWSIPDIFGFAYCGQPRDDGPGNRGFVTNHRWHILDDLPFKSRINFFMELYSHKPTPGFSYARLAYHYGRPGMVDDHLPITDADVRELELPADWKPNPGWGAQGSTFWEPEALLENADQHTIEFVEGNLYSAGWLMVWRPQRPGESIVFTIPIAEAAKHSLDLCAAMTEQSGEIQISLAQRAPDNEWRDELTGNADLKAPGRVMLRRIETKPADLEPGEYRLVLTCPDPPGCEIGIDFIWVQKR